MPRTVAALAASADFVAYIENDDSEEPRLVRHCEGGLTCFPNTAHTWDSVTRRFAGSLQDLHNQPGWVELQLTEALAAAPVVMFAKSFCVYCAQLRATLQQAGIEYTEITLHDGDSSLGDQEVGLKLELAKRSGKHTVPQLYVNGTFVETEGMLAEQLKANVDKHLELENGLN